MDKPEKLRSAQRIASTPDWKFQDPQLPKSIWYHTMHTFGFRVVRPPIIPSSEEMHKYWTTEGEPDNIVPVPFNDFIELVKKNKTFSKENAARSS